MVLALSENDVFRAMSMADGIRLVEECGGTGNTSAEDQPRSAG